MQAKYKQNASKNFNLPEVSGVSGILAPGNGLFACSEIQNPPDVNPHFSHRVLNSVVQGLNPLNSFLKQVIKNETGLSGLIYLFNSAPTTIRSQQANVQAFAIRKQSMYFRSFRSGWLSSAIRRFKVRKPLM